MSKKHRVSGQACECVWCKTASPPLPDSPCQELPGTREKVERMKQRVAEQVQLFHPNDAAWGGQVADRAGKLVRVVAAVDGTRDS